MDMTRRKKILLIVGGIGALGAGSFFLTRNKPNSPIYKFWAGIFGYNTDLNVSSSTTGSSSLEDVKPVIQTSSTVTSTNFADNFPACRNYKREVFPIGIGMKGNVVRDIQANLKDLHGKSLAVDGCFGSKTEAAVKSVLGAGKVSTDGFLLIKKAEKAETADILGNLNPLNWF